VPLTPTFRSAGAWSFVANNVPTPASLAPGAPAGVAVGDLLVLVSESRSITATAATPTGWNLVTGFPKRSATSAGGTIYVWTRTADGTATDTPTVTWSGLTTGTTGDATGAGLLAYTNATEVLDGTVQSSDLSAQTTTSVIPAFTTATANSLVIGIAMKLLESSGQTSTVATFTERADNGTTSGTGHTIEVSDKVQTVAGSSGTATVTWSATTSARAFTVSLALKAAAGDAAAGGTIGTLTLSAATATATGGAAGTGSVGMLTLTASTATAVVNASAAGTIGTLTLSSPTATAAGDAAATGTLPTLTLSPTTASASGGATGAAAIATLTFSSATATATGDAAAAGSLGALTLAAPSASATGAGSGAANASGSIGTLNLTSPTATATGDATTSGTISGLVFAAATGRATGGAVIGGTIPALMLAAPLATATGGQAVAAVPADGDTSAGARAAASTIEQRRAEGEASSTAAADGSTEAAR
jgi:hypothetical protein